MTRTSISTATALALGGVLMALSLRPAAARLVGGPVEATPPASATAIRDVRVFDGERVLPRATVVIVGPLIEAVGADVKVPAAATVIEGAGRTLLPGLIDAHTHAFGDALERALVFGVTTELEMFGDHAQAARLRAEQAAGKAAARADLLSAGTLVTAPGGHGTEYGMKIPTLERAVDADAFLAARLAEGSDYIKAVYDDGSGFGLRWPTLDRATLAAVAAAARRRERLALVHVGTARSAHEALEAGAHGLVHLFADSEPIAGFVELARRQGAFVIPTLTVVQSLSNAVTGARLADDPRLAPYLRGTEAQSLRGSFPLPPGRPKLDPAIASRTVRALSQAGVPILAGTDAPNPGTVHGASLHREMELLVAAGLTPLQALAAATAVPARAFGLRDRGRVAPGLRADLVLVEGDPAQDIKATRAIALVFKSGVRARRDRPDAAVANARIEDGRVSDFEQESALAARFGSGWQPSSDDRMGGKSEARLERSSPGAGGTAGALRVSGTLRTEAPYPWAGAMFFPGSSPATSVDVSAFRAVRFRARGDGRTYRVMLFARRLGSIPASAEFETTKDWREITLPFSSFGGGLDGADLWGVLFSAGPPEGEFRFEIDDVAFVKEP